MNSLRRLLGLLVTLLIGMPLARAAEFASTDAVLWGNYIIVLRSDGAFAAWEVPVGSADKRIASDLTLAGVLHLACDGSRLWVATDTELYSRESGANSWSKMATFPKRESQLLALVVVGQSPLLVYPSVVMDPVAKKEFPVPNSEGQVHTNVLRLLAIYRTDTMAWFGTGHGEWGGSLIGLNPSTGAWVQHTDSLHYVTGITSTVSDQVLVAWSMSHFMATTMIRGHGKTGKPVQEWQELQDKYYQQIAFSRLDRSLYGIENRSLVRIVEGRPVAIVELPGRLFSPEPNAIGVSPGIRAVIPVASLVVVVVPNVGSPLRVDVTKGTVARLE